ncbi:hypothetical protein DFH11DRAFT_831316 [Phellopilus nigrolimitatus]|nr:hypothetical protein DFH11DRAFT_831316 [Phellopilus nigrolimitatus]
MNRFNSLNSHLPPRFRAQIHDTPNEQQNQELSERLLTEAVTAYHRSYFPNDPRHTGIGGLPYVGHGYYQNTGQHVFPHFQPPALVPNALNSGNSQATVAPEYYRGNALGMHFDLQRNNAHTTPAGTHRAFDARMLMCSAQTCISDSLFLQAAEQKVEGEQAEATPNQDKCEIQSLPSNHQHRVSLFLHEVLAYGQSDFTWRVSHPVTTAQCGADLAPPSVLHSSAMIPPRSSIEVVVGEGLTYDVRIVATPLTCPTLVGTNHKTGEPEYKPVLTVCAVMGNLYRAFNTRLPAAHWRTLSINQKLFLAKGLRTRRGDDNSGMFNDAMSVWNFNLNEEEQRCVEVEMHQLLDAYAFPVEEGSMISSQIQGVLVGDYLGGKTMFKGLQLGQEDKFILHTA